MNKTEKTLEKIIFASRWIQMPVYLGLIIGGLIYLYKFFSELFNLLANLFILTSAEILFGLLTLIDISLVLNLLFMVIIGGYSTFVSKIDFENNEDKPNWIDKIDAGTIKVKLSMSIVIIAAIDLLRSYVDIEHAQQDEIYLKLLIFCVLLITVLALVFTNKMLHK